MVLLGQPGTSGPDSSLWETHPEQNSSIHPYPCALTVRDSAVFSFLRPGWQLASASMLQGALWLGRKRHLQVISLLGFRLPEFGASPGD